MGLLQEILGAGPLGTLVFSCQAPIQARRDHWPPSAHRNRSGSGWSPCCPDRCTHRSALTEADNYRRQTLPTLSRLPSGTVTRWILSSVDKWFISSAATADFIIVVAVTGPDADRHRRASQFIVPIDAPGLTVVRDIASVENPKPRPHGYGSTRSPCAMSAGFGCDARRPWRRIRVAQIRLGPGRIHHCMRWIGQAARAFDMMCERATYRSAPGLLADKPRPSGTSSPTRRRDPGAATDDPACRLAYRQRGHPQKPGTSHSSSSLVPACCTG